MGRETFNIVLSGSPCALSCSNCYYRSRYLTTLGRKDRFITNGRQTLNVSEHFRQQNVLPSPPVVDSVLGAAAYAKDLRTSGKSYSYTDNNVVSLHINWNHGHALAQAKMVQEISRQVLNTSLIDDVSFTFYPSQTREEDSEKLIESIHLVGRDKEITNLTFSNGFSFYTGTPLASEIRRIASDERVIGSLTSDTIHTMATRWIPTCNNLAVRSSWRRFDEALSHVPDRNKRLFLIVNKPGRASWLRAYKQCLDDLRASRIPVMPDHCVTELFMNRECRATRNYIDIDHYGDIRRCPYQEDPDIIHPGTETTMGRRDAITERISEFFEAADGPPPCPLFKEEEDPDDTNKMGPRRRRWEDRPGYPHNCGPSM